MNSEVVAVVTLVVSAVVVYLVVVAGVVACVVVSVVVEQGGMMRLKMVCAGREPSHIVSSYPQR